MLRHQSFVTLALFVWDMCSPIEADIHNLVAVSPLTSFEEFYTRKKHETLQTYVDADQGGQLREVDYLARAEFANGEILPAPRPGFATREYDLLAKSRICTRVFNSGFFEMRGEEAVSFDFGNEEIEWELKNQSEELYTDIFATWPYLEPEDFVNLYAQRDVIVGSENFKESTFICLTRERDSRKILQYFLSPIYEWYVPYNRHITTGRFVFSPNENLELTVLAFAEEAAKIDKEVTRSTHTAYYNARGSLDYLELEAASNPVCNMSTEEKLRLCTIVFNARGLRNEFTFLPATDNVEPECVKRPVSGRVQIDRFESEEIVEIIYDEWMIGCKVKRVAAEDDEDPWKTYSISRGLDANTMIVFRKHESIDDLYSAYVGVSGVGIITGSGLLKSILVNDSDSDSTCSDWFINL